jgi:hypothetical protein
VERNLAHAVDQILERLGVERKINAVHVLAAQRRVHDDGRQRMLDGIAGDAIDASGGVDLLDAVDTAQIARADLAGRGFEILADRAKGKTLPARTPSTRLMMPCSPMHRPISACLSALRLQKLHHGHVVGERGGGGDDFVEVGRDLQHFSSVSSRLRVARKSWKDRMSPARLRRRATASGFAFSALCSSRSTI